MWFLYVSTMCFLLIIKITLIWQVVPNFPGNKENEWEGKRERRKKGKWETKQGKRQRGKEKDEVKKWKNSLVISSCKDYERTPSTYTLHTKKILPKNPRTIIMQNKTQAHTSKWRGGKKHRTFIKFLPSIFPNPVVHKRQELLGWRPLEEIWDCTYQKWFMEARNSQSILKLSPTIQSHPRRASSPAYLWVHYSRGKNFASTQLLRHTCS